MFGQSRTEISVRFCERKYKLGNPSKSLCFWHSSITSLASTGGNQWFLQCWLSRPIYKLFDTWSPVPLPFSFSFAANSGQSWHWQFQIFFFGTISTFATRTIELSKCKIFICFWWQIIILWETNLGEFVPKLQWLRPPSWILDFANQPAPRKLFSARMAFSDKLHTWIYLDNFLHCVTSWLKVNPLRC